ncbi:hypothetical protein M3Y94_00033700 [Aphelenchoides besseyi]|nr:hypothetical protein M3Y94_00033700 [Aphelenchoides besseyi]KAI6218595.1 hypothetical protein M3Y95_01159400 [Aphelenchoides besseyi]
MCDKDFDVDMFDVYYWVQSNRGLCGSKDQPYVLSQSIRHYVPFNMVQLFCKIVAKRCPLCESKSTSDQLKDAQKKLETAIQTINKLEGENDELRKELTSAKFERDKFSVQLKMKERNDKKSNNLKALWQLQQQNKLTDFTFLVEGKTIQVHKVVLSTASKFFAQQFEEHPEKSDYSIEGTSFEAVEAMIYFIYLYDEVIIKEKGDEKDDEKDDEIVEDVYKLSIRFSISKLHQIFLEAFKSALTVDNAPELIILAAKNRDDKLKKMAIDFVDRNGGGKAQILLTDLFVCLLKEDVQLYTKILNDLRA